MTGRPEGGSTYNNDFSGATISGNHGTFGGGTYYAAPGSPAEETMAQVEQLVRVIDGYARQIQDLQTARENAQEVKEQVARGGAKPGVLRSLLQGIAAAAPGVGAVADAVSKVQAAVGGLLS